MKTYRDPYIKLDMPTVVALGCFDGVHVAHACVIGEAVRIARERGAAACVWCFSEPPKNAYIPTPVPLITDGEEKARQIRRLGADILISPDFMPDIASLSPEEFVCKLLFECAGATHLVCGANYTFGRGGEGKVDTLCRLCEGLGIGVSVVDDVTVDSVKVSSTLIREAVTSGQCSYAARLLGRDFCVLARRDSQGELFISQKLLCVPEGEYEVSASAKNKKYLTRASVSRIHGGSRITLETDDDAQEYRIHFLSNRQRPKKTGREMYSNEKDR